MPALECVSFNQSPSRNRRLSRRILLQEAVGVLVDQQGVTGDLGEVGATPAGHWKAHLILHQHLAMDLRGPCLI